MNAAACPECGASVTVPSNTVQHELIPCADCGTELEIVSLNPLVVERAPEIQEDWGE